MVKNKEARAACVKRAKLGPVLLSYIVGAKTVVFPVGVIFLLSLGFGPVPLQSACRRGCCYSLRRVRNIVTRSRLLPPSLLKLVMSCFQVSTSLME